jgi:hypothetical protein
MAGQDFGSLVESGLLRQAEAIVIESHRGLYAKRGRPWSRPVAYRWLRYEDQAPVERLIEGVARLRRLGARFDPEAVEKACAEASRRGFLI